MKLGLPGSMSPLVAPNAAALSAHRSINNSQPAPNTAVWTTRDISRHRNRVYAGLDNLCELLGWLV